MSEYILPLSTSLSVFRALCGRASLPALAIYPVSLSPVSSLLFHPLPGFHLALRHSYFCPAILPLLLAGFSRLRCGLAMLQARP